MISLNYCWYINCNQKLRTMLKIIRKFVCDLTGVTCVIVENELGRQYTLLESEIREMRKMGFTIN